MCGIAGYVGKGDREVLEAMGSTLAHRGPDDSSVWVGRGAGMAHRRLSIIDLSKAGRQPMSNEDGTVWIVFNGEIYNFHELRKRLERHTFKSHTDTEVIVHRFEEVGTAVFAELRGMFAIAIYDAKRRELHLARDGMGKKPLYWTEQNGTFAFASELKAFFAHPAISCELDIDALGAYLQFEYVPTPRSILKNIQKLPPGHSLMYDGKKVRLRRFWDIPVVPPTELFKGSIKDAAHRLDELMATAVERRLESDVPLGIFLSGGMDSSTVAWYARQKLDSVSTFSVAFRERSFDESSYARRVAEHLGTKHHECILSASDSLELVEDIIGKLDEPLADASVFPTYLLSRFTKEKVAVALSGDGADELFLGYDTFVAERLARMTRPLWPLMRTAGKLFANALPTSFENMTLEFRLRRFLEGLGGEEHHRHVAWLGAFPLWEQRRLFRASVWNSLDEIRMFEEYDALWGRTKGADHFSALSYVYQRGYLMDQVLVKVDRASMMHGLEVRSPFLDTDIVSFAQTLPSSMKIHGFTGKFVLKLLMRDRLPREVTSRSKKGFGIPLARWLADDLSVLVEHYLGSSYITAQGLFDPLYIERLVREHRARKRDHRKQLWTLLVFQMWHEKWMR